MLIYIFQNIKKIFNMVIYVIHSISDETINKFKL